MVKDGSSVGFGAILFFLHVWTDGFVLDRASSGSNIFQDNDGL